MKRTPAISVQNLTKYPINSRISAGAGTTYKKNESIEDVFGGTQGWITLGIYMRRFYIDIKMYSRTPLNRKLVIRIGLAVRVNLSRILQNLLAL